MAIWIWIDHLDAAKAFVGARLGAVDPDGPDGTPKSGQGNSSAPAFAIYQLPYHLDHLDHLVNKAVSGCKAGTCRLTRCAGLIRASGSSGRLALGNPMSRAWKPSAPRTAARVSPAAAPGPRVVVLARWREDHAPIFPHGNNAGLGARTLGQASRSGTRRPDRLAHALAWCQAYTATGRNPFDPARLQQAID